MSSRPGGGWVYVDDADSSIVYSGGDWITSANSGPSGASGVFDGTLHGAQTQGITATFKFSGSEVGVVGTSGLTNEYGWPAVDFSIDGVQQYTNTFPASISRDTLFTNVTFFDSPVSAGEHVLTITNLNGTAPNTFWFDYIFYAPVSDAPSSLTSALSAGNTEAGSSSSASEFPGHGHGGAVTSAATGSASANSHASATSPASIGSASASEGTQASRGSLSSLGAMSSSAGPSGTLARGSGTSSPSSSPSEAPGIHESSSVSSKKHTGAIVGGVVGEIVPVDSVEGARTERRVTILDAETLATTQRVPLSKEQPPRATARREAAAVATSNGEVAYAAVPHAASPAANMEEAALPAIATASAQPGRRQTREDSDQSRAKTMVRAMTSRIRSRMHWRGVRVVQEVDSGLRLPVDEDVVETLPPPYSAR
ncbi:hypothetical protein FKP32DRAFT_1605685 [Trametes sanguinea]|nr:hypothetical protein FKP32DRAFT_1605685 [Trametes sanguinea]